MTKNRVALLVLGFTLSWATIELLVPQSGVSLFEVIWARCTVDVIGMLLFTGLRVERLKALVQTQHLGRHICRSFALLGMSLFSLWAIQGMPAINSLCILWGAPLIVLLIDRLFLHEVWGWKISAIVVSGYAGVLLLARPVFTWSWSMLPAFAAAVCLAIFIVMTRVMRNEMLMPKLFHAALWSALALTPIMPFFWQTPTLHGWIVLVSIGLFGWIMLFFLCRSLETAPSGIFAPAIYGMAGWLYLFAIMRHHQAPTRGLWLGIFIIAGAVVTLLFMEWPAKHRLWTPEVVGDT